MSSRPLVPSFMPSLAILLTVLLIAPRSVHAAPAPGTDLEAAYQAAFSRNELLRQSAEQVTQAQERVSQYRGAILPNLSVNASHVLQDEPEDPIAREFSPGQQTTAALTLTQPLFRGFREFSALRQQKRVLSAQEFARAQSAQRLYQEVATGYLNILALEQDALNLEEQSQIYGRRVQDLDVRARRGESSTTELLSAQSTQASVLAEIRLVQGQLRIARAGFASLTGLAQDSALRDPGLVPASGPEQGRPGELSKYLSRIEERPDVRAAAALVEAAEEGSSFASGGHWPTVDLQGNYYLKRPGFLEDIKWDVAFRLTMPLYAGGTTQSQVREASSRQSQAEQELARVRRLAADEIRAFHETLGARVDQIALLRKSVALSERNVSVSQGDFRRGLTRNIDVQLALGEYRVSRRALDQARFAAQLDLVRLELAAAQRGMEGTK